MAKTNKDSKADLERKKGDKSEREKKEKQEYDQKRKEKEKKKQARQKTLQRNVKKEQKRIKEAINFPFKILFQAGLSIASVFFIVEYFGRGKELYKAMFNSFLLFTAVYLGVGVLMITIFYVMAESKKREKEEQKHLEEENKAKDEQFMLEQQAKREEESRENERKRREEMRKFRENLESDKKNGNGIHENEFMIDEMGNNHIPGDFDGINNHFVTQEEIM
jgi:uncharacterized membrane protein YcjF (UPF0283 family)